MTNRRKNMADKFPFVLRIVGFSLCLVCTAYMLYYAYFWRLVSVLEESGAKSFIIAGMVAVAEGEVVRSDDEYTIIQYYYEWDGAEYRSVKRHVSGDYPENAKLPVVYSVGSGMGSCLAVGFYRKPMQVLGLAGAVMLLSGLMSFRRGL